MTGRIGMIADAELGGGHIRVAHELLGKNFAGFELGRFFRWTKYAQTGLMKKIHEAQRQRLLWADHRQVDFLLLGPFGQPVEIGGFDGDVDAILGRAGVAWRAVNSGDPRGLGQFPDQGVFAPAFADHQYLHESSQAPRWY